jgi:hypothetical protein
LHGKLRKYLIRLLPGFVLALSALFFIQ